MTHGENGRAIMTRQLAKGVKERLGVDGQNVRNILHKAAMKMLFKQRMSTTMNGPAHDQTFITTVRTVVPHGAIQPTPADATAMEDDAVELVNTGVAFGKKESQALALIDLYEQFTQCGINPKDPPDVRKMLMERAKESQQAKKNRAQMLLEMLNSTRPSMVTSQKQRNFVTEVSMLVDGGKKLKLLIRRRVCAQSH